MNQIVIIAASGTHTLAKTVADTLRVPWFPVESGEFPNEELKITVPEAGVITILFGSIAKPVNNRLVEYLLAADAIKRLGCRHIIGALSWYPYSKQDKVFLPGEPLSAKVVACLLQDVSLKQLITLELHNPSIAGYFEIPVSNLSATGLFVDHLKSQDLSNTVVVSPDAGSIKNSTKVAETLGLPIAYAAKSRDLTTGKVTVTEINRDIKGKNILIFDDMIASGSTLVEVSAFLKNREAKEITVASTHHLYLHDAQQKLDESPIDHLIVTNSIQKPDSIKSDKLTIIDVAPVFAKILRDQQQN